MASLKRDRGLEVKGHMLQGQEVFDVDVSDFQGTLL